MLDRQIGAPPGAVKSKRASHERVVQAGRLCDARGWRSGAVS
jgi:hypothetical protein